MQLPRIAGNRLWYCVWIMLLDVHDDPVAAPFVQGGLMRWAEHRYDLTAFIANAKRDAPIAYDDVGDLHDGWHRVTLRGDDAHVDLLVDGAQVHRFDRRATIAKGTHVYAEIGAEVRLPGDSIGASVRDVRVKRDTDDAPHAENIACMRYDRGLQFRDVAGTLEASGTFSLDAESGYLDACDDVTS